MGKRLLILGCGYCGQALSAEAVRRGWEVWAQSRNAEKLARLESVPAERRIVGLLEESGWQELVKGDFEAVVNLVSSAGGGLDGYRRSYVEGNRSVLEWLRGRSVGRFIFTSATSVYPQTDGRWVAEDDVPAEAEALSANGAVLREAERLVLGAEGPDFRGVLRLGGIYGPMRHLYLDRLLRGERVLPGDGEGWLNLIHRDDIVGAILAVLEGGQAEAGEGIWNVVDNEPAKKRAIADWLAERVGSGPVRFDPTIGRSASGRRRVGNHAPNRRVSNRKFREWSGWQPRYADYRAGYSSILAGMGSDPARGHDRSRV